MLKCLCGSEIDLTTGKCKGCGTQNIEMRGNSASIKMTEPNGDIIELTTRKDDTEPDIKVDIK